MAWQIDDLTYKSDMLIGLLGYWAFQPLRLCHQAAITARGELRVNQNVLLRSRRVLLEIAIGRDEFCRTSRLQRSHRCRP